MICTGCGHDTRFPVTVNGKPYHVLCARRITGEVRQPEWLRRSKDRSLNPHGLAKDLTGGPAL